MSKNDVYESKYSIPADCCLCVSIQIIFRIEIS